MEENSKTEAMSAIVKILEPFEEKDQKRIFNAAMILLGSGIDNLEEQTVDQGMINLPLQAKTWMKYHGIDVAKLEQVFHMDAGQVSVIAATIPGKNKKEQTINCYILSGLSQLLSDGKTTFDDKSARQLCVKAGCYDSSNHASTMSSTGNSLAGSKAKGWILTAPGQKAAADLVKEISGQS